MEQQFGLEVVGGAQIWQGVLLRRVEGWWLATMPSAQLAMFLCRSLPVRPVGGVDPPGESLAPSSVPVLAMFLSIAFLPEGTSWSYVHLVPQLSGVSG